MRAMRFLGPALCLYVGLVLSLSYTSVFGPMGARERARLEQQALTLEENLRELERINQELSEELSSLSSDAETVALLARDLGYYRHGDRRVAVEGLPLQAAGRPVGRLVITGEGGDQARGGLRIALFLSPFAAWVMARAAVRVTNHGGAARRS